MMVEMDYAKKMQKCHEYVEALEEEQKKIQVFQRELPLCLELVTQGNNNPIKISNFTQVSYKSLYGS